MPQASGCCPDQKGGEYPAPNGGNSFYMCLSLSSLRFILFQRNLTSEATIISTANTSNTTVSAYGMNTEASMHEKREMSDHFARYDGGGAPGGEETSHVQGFQNILSLGSDLNRPANNCMESTTNSVSKTISVNKETATAVSARKLPKKRKFDPSELEELEKTSADNHFHNQNKSVVVCANLTAPSQSVVVMPPQAAAVDYSYVSSMPKQSEDLHVPQHMAQQSRMSSIDTLMDTVIENQIPHQPENMRVLRSDGSNCMPVLNIDSSLIVGSRKHVQMSGRSDIDLREWQGNHVLAKKDKRYLPGVIQRAEHTGEVWVNFDYDNEVAAFTDVLGSGKYDVIGDASPSMGQVQVGARVCVRAADPMANHRVFFEGVVYKILSPPVQYLVKLIGGQSQELLVKRADLRLLLPPWWDELECLKDGPHPVITNNGSSNGRVYMPNSNGQLQQPSVLHTHQPTPPHPVPLQLHHVVPTLQPADASNYYRSAATSPLHSMTTPVSIHSTSTALSNGSADDLRRRQYDDFCESDDDLRKEDILFSLDTGWLTLDFTHFLCFYVLELNVQIKYFL